MRITAPPAHSRCRQNYLWRIRKMPEHTIVFACPVCVPEIAMRVAA